MLHKIVETGETDDKGNNLLKYVTKIMFFFLRQTRHADYYHRFYNHRDRHVGYHIWDRIYDYKKTFSFSLKGPGITPI